MVAKLFHSFHRNSERFSLSILFALVALVPTLAQAFPITSTKPWVWPYEVEVERGVFNFNGITALSNCSASYVRFKGASEDSRALILTNGHCTGGFFGGMPKPGEVIHNRPQTFNVSLLDQNGRKIATLRAEKVVYGTMTLTDAALLELNQTYRQIKTQTGVDPLFMADYRANPGVAIEIPSGYWKRTYRCQLDGFVHELREGGYTMRDSVRYSATGCEVIGGTSGSPIVSTLTGEVIAINNTGNENGQSCTMNNPCEVDPQGNVTVIPGRGYGQQTYWFYSCLNRNGEFDLSVGGCVLPKPRSFSLH